MNERNQKVQDAASFYVQQILNIDYHQADFVYRSIRPYFKGNTALELGPASGYMTKSLVNDFQTLHLIEGSKSLIDQIPDYPNVTKHCSMFEEFESNMQFDTIIMSHVLEHIEKPLEVLNKIKYWLKDDGIFIISVPNAKSLHRIVAVKMGLLESEYTLNQRDLALGHYRVYDLQTLSIDITNSGFKVIKSGGSFLKPLSNAQIEEYWTNEMVEGFFELGKQFPENCAEIFIICSK
ncbi:MAG: class I SAM-dependent methyltransferase [Ferruginibacter sp.]